MSKLDVVRPDVFAGTETVRLAVEIHPEDTKNMDAILEIIRKTGVTDEAVIRTIVDSYQFSSPETQQHTSNRIVELSTSGVFDDQPLNAILF